MIPGWALLNDTDRASYHAIHAFLENRLAERATVEWALDLKSEDTVKRAVVRDLINNLKIQKIGEPWYSAWNLIDECWNRDAPRNDDADDAYPLKQRLRAGDRSGAVIAKIISLVEPRVMVERLSNLYSSAQKTRKQPRKIEDLFRAYLTSSKVFDPSELELKKIDDKNFLISLCNALDAAVIAGLDIARRVGWADEHSLWKLGELYRVYYVPEDLRQENEHEPDEFHRGIAPSVKLLHATVMRLADIDLPLAIEFFNRWSKITSPVHVRLWATFAKDTRFDSIKNISAKILTLSDRCFWDLHLYPEIAELRAACFSKFEDRERQLLLVRLHKLPPRNFWPKDIPKKKVESARIYWAVRELRRLNLNGLKLPRIFSNWIKSKSRRFPEFSTPIRPDDGFNSSPKARFVPPNPDNRFDVIFGKDRLTELENALQMIRSGWESDPSGRASDWIRHGQNALNLISDFESVGDGGANFPHVWERFGWSHSAPKPGATPEELRVSKSECRRVINLILKLPNSSLLPAIEGVSHWFSAWEKLIVTLPSGLKAWLKLWPIAVESTNEKQPRDENVALDTVARRSNSSEPLDLDTLNTPVGKLVGVFLVACPTVKDGGASFSRNSAQRRMRDAIDVSFRGHSGLIVRYRLIEGFSYFLRADKNWTIKKLLPFLEEDSTESRILWRAFSRRMRFRDDLQLVGDKMIERANDRQLGREARRSLVFNLVVECLFSFLDNRESVVSNIRIEQMLRSLDDEVRAHAAGTVTQFVRDISAEKPGKEPSVTAEHVFKTAAEPFLKTVWPQERSLTTPGVSKAFARLPATSGNAFSSAVSAIERFLVPFDSWSMIDYGLYGDKNGLPKIAMVNRAEKAAAFLKLLDLTIGSTENSVIPSDLPAALDHIQRISPRLSREQAFRRLAAAARR